MKALTTFIVLFLFQTFVFGQGEYHYSSDFEKMRVQYTPMHYNPINDVNIIEFTKTNKKGKKFKYEKQYASGNRLLKFFEYRKGEKLIKLENEYDSIEKVTSSKIYKKGEFKYVLNYKRNLDLKITELSKVLANGEYKYKNTWAYNSDGCLTDHSRFKKENKLNRKSVTEYFSACDKSKTTLYNGKGKIKKIWTYDCKKEGEELIKKKDVNQVCKWEETVGEFLIKVYQTFNEKGKIYKNVSKYTKVDTLIVERKVYNEDGIITYFSSFDKAYERPILSQWYSKKGKLKWSNEFRYENKKVISRIKSFKGKVKTSSKYEYNSEEFLTKYTLMNKKGELTRTIDLQYN
jgi:hypothetical protein